MGRSHLLLGRSLPNQSASSRPTNTDVSVEQGNDEKDINGLPLLHDGPRLSTAPHHPSTETLTYRPHTPLTLILEFLCLTWRSPELPWLGRKHCSEGLTLSAPVVSTSALSLRCLVMLLSLPSHPSSRSTEKASKRFGGHCNPVLVSNHMFMYGPISTSDKIQNLDSPEMQLPGPAFPSPLSKPRWMKPGVKFMKVRGLPS